MAGTQDDGSGPATTHRSAQETARLVRKAEALRANLRRRKSQSRGRADKPDAGRRSPNEIVSLGQRLASASAARGRCRKRLNPFRT